MFFILSKLDQQLTNKSYSCGTTLADTVGFYFFLRRMYVRKLLPLYFAANLKNVVDVSGVFVLRFALFGFGMSEKDE